MTTKPIIIDCEQGDSTWHEWHCKMPTSSCFSQVMAEGKGLTRLTYMRKLAGAMIVKRPIENFENDDMRRGKLREPIIRSEYMFLTSREVAKVGFIHNGIAGCSPDGTIGDDGLLEIKDAKPHIWAEVKLREAFPPEHKAQVQGSLWVTERKWCDLVVGCEGAPLHIRRTFRDSAYIAELEREVLRFNKDLRAMVAQLKAKR